MIGQGAVAQLAELVLAPASDVAIREERARVIPAARQRNDGGGQAGDRPRDEPRAPPSQSPAPRVALRRGRARIQVAGMDRRDVADAHDRDRAVTVLRRSVTDEAIIVRAPARSGLRSPAGARDVESGAHGDGIVDARDAKRPRAAARAVTRLGREIARTQRSPQAAAPAPHAALTANGAGMGLANADVDDVLEADDRGRHARSIMVPSPSFPSARSRTLARRRCTARVPGGRLRADRRRCCPSRARRPIVFGRTRDQLRTRPPPRREHRR